MNKPRALLTGASGFTGCYVAHELCEAGYDVIGMSSGGLPSNAESLDIDLLDRQAVLAAVAKIQPTVVIHLAAIAFVAHGNVDDIYRINVIGTRHLLEALAEIDPVPEKVVLASSANVYGNVLVEQVRETTPAAPANDYAVSKLAMEYMARLWMDRLPIVIVRPFNYTGVGQSTLFLVPKIVDHFRRCAKRIELGNIHVWRDFSDVRIVAKIYAQLVQRAPAGETFNICSGNAHSLAEILDMMHEIAGYKIAVDINPDFVREHEVPRLVGDPAKLTNALDEYQAIPLRTTLQWMFETRGTTSNVPVV